MAYLSLARFTGDPDVLLATYARSEPTMTAVGRDHGLLVHAAARTDAGLLVMNLWPSPDGSKTASRDPRRLAALRDSGLTAEQIRRVHHDVRPLRVARLKPRACP